MQRIRARPLLERVTQLLGADAIERPKWYDAVRRNPPEPPRPPMLKPPKLHYEQDRLISTYKLRHVMPFADQQDQIFKQVNIENPRSRMNMFVHKQLALMKKGVPEEEAYREVEIEFLREEYLLRLEEETSSRQCFELGLPKALPSKPSLP
mmetsp:Transcript_4706/g.7321  ORF Transcript_4706/g.7321 Transcript_4706/m.7321 type:complete len:151 (-) Transcript_4706:591-1043(-)